MPIDSLMDLIDAMNKPIVDLSLGKIFFTLFRYFSASKSGLSIVLEKNA